MTENGRPPYPHLYQINVSDGGVPKRPVLRLSSPRPESRVTGSRISKYMADPIVLSVSIRKN